MTVNRDIGSVMQGMSSFIPFDVVGLSSLSFWFCPAYTVCEIACGLDEQS